MEIAPDTRMGLVELSVSDLERSLAYWQDTVGLRVLSRENGTAELGVDEPLLRFVEEPGATSGSGLHRSFPRRAAPARPRRASADSSRTSFATASRSPASPITS